VEELNIFLKANLIEVSYDQSREMINGAGDFFIAPIPPQKYQVPEIKQLCEGFEEQQLLGRFIDVDVHDENGEPVTSGKSKLCFYCRQKPAIECRRENAHDILVLRDFMFSEMDNYCRKDRKDKVVRKVSALAMKAVLYEISLTPKPGLVDKMSSGSHSDMNYSIFLESSASLFPWFATLVQEGFSFGERDPGKVLPVIRYTGLQMEKEMFRHTRGVNTQKGLIFLMGLSLFTCGILFEKFDAFDSGYFRETIRKICKNITKELEINQPDKTHGKQVYDKYLISGIRGEVMEGLPTVFDRGLPELIKYNAISDEALLSAFLAIASENSDTNILYRSNIQVLNTFKMLARKAYDSHSSEDLNKLIAYCRDENISPGGSADLLVMSNFIFEMIHSGKITG
jgi:holo-ACP synthase/triphosphoribosyl-dephospho-CoA synthase